MRCAGRFAVCFERGVGEEARILMYDLKKLLELEI